MEGVRGVRADGRQRVDGGGGPNRVGGDLGAGRARPQRAVRAVPRQGPHLRRPRERAPHGVHVIGDEQSQLQNL